MPSGLSEKRSTNHLSPLFIPCGRCHTCFSKTDVLSISACFIIFRMYSNCFSKRLHLFSAANNWDVSSKMNTHKKVVIS